MSPRQPVVSGERLIKALRREGGEVVRQRGSHARLKKVGRKHALVVPLHHDALTLSRLVRDNGFSTQYAARLLDYEDGQRCVVYVHREDKSIWRLHRDREWLDAPEGRELAALLAAYWECREQPPPRVRRAMWRMAYAPSMRWPTWCCRSWSAGSRRC